MRNNLKLFVLVKFTKIYLFSVFLSIVLFYLIFVKRIIIVDYVYCSELLTYTKPFNFVFPRSCDQNYYFLGFQKVSNIFNYDFNYQERPLYILFIFLINKLVSVFRLEEIFTLYLSVTLGQIFISSTGVYILDELLLKKHLIKKSKSITISFFIILSPLFKWGIFDPSHQLITLIVILFTILFSEVYSIEFNFKKSILYGFLFLLHREFVISFIFILLFKKFKIDKNFKVFNKYYLNFLYSYIPTILYQFYIRFYLGQQPYDANTEYWGQFIWIAYFLLGKNKYASEWHCVSIPENFYCYLSDTLNLINYLMVPILLIMVTLLISKKIYRFHFLGLEFVIFLYIFWSFIGWYPPIRFNYYSLGHFIIITTIVIYFSIEKKLERALFLFTYLFFTLFLNHWNYAAVVEYNLGVITSFIFLIFYSIIISNVKK